MGLGGRGSLYRCNESENKQDLCRLLGGVLDIGVNSLWQISHRWNYSIFVTESTIMEWVE